MLINWTLKEVLAAIYTDDTQKQFGDKGLVNILRNDMDDFILRRENHQHSRS